MDWLHVQSMTKSYSLLFFFSKLYQNNKQVEYLNYFIIVCYWVSHEFQNDVNYCGFVQIDCLNY